tara:strand:- start:14 stop:172 length:159 start_codon:yes stop_codon:yes gene_type:complete
VQNGFVLKAVALFYPIDFKVMLLISVFRDQNYLKENSSLIKQFIHLIFSRNS